LPFQRLNKALIVPLILNANSDFSEKKANARAKRALEKSAMPKS